MCQILCHIVSTSHSPVPKLRKWWTAAFRPLLEIQISYLKNSFDVVNKLKTRHRVDNNIFSSFDVVAMYTNCDEKCKFILKNKIQKHTESIQDVTLASMDVEAIMKLVSLVNNYSLYLGFRGEFFQQVFGLLM